MAANLVIVESPAKAKTIEKFLGAEFTVKSSYGHIRDLVKDNMGVDIANNFSPNYEISPDKRALVAELKKAVKEASVVWLASDGDREGEAIAWHLSEVLKLNDASTRRIVFHEITKEAIVRAIENPRQIDKHLVDAQQARRILDRIVGFELSPVLWKKVKNSLSAGRVQSVAVRLIVEREREIINFKSESSFKVSALFSFTAQNGVPYQVKAELNNKIKNQPDAYALLEQCKTANFSVSNVETKPTKRTPSAPFTTSTLQQEASRKLGFPVARTMMLAQALYEAGHITYMRTDSLNLSDQAIGSIKQAVTSKYGEQYSKVRKFQTKTKGAQEAHEAIRPTYINNTNVSDNYDEQRLYDLIWKRTIASQMSDAVLQKTTVDIAISTVKNYRFIVQGEVVVFDGFLKVYVESTDDEDEESDKVILPPMQVNDVMKYENITATQRFTLHAPRYTEASLVKKLEELGIGRPSTYAPTISTVQKRGYVVREDRTGERRNYSVLELKANVIKESEKSENTGSEKSKLFPTDIGMVVTDFLVKYFTQILDYNFTASVEKEFDEIAEGSINWNQMIHRFYASFHPTVEETIQTTEKNTGERILGVDPKSGKPVSVRIGRFGPMVQIGAADDEAKQYTSLTKGHFLETITLEDALQLMNNASEGRQLGVDPATGKMLVVKVGRYGPFVQRVLEDGEKPQYASLKKGQSPDTITLIEALDLLRLPRQIGEFEGKPVSAAVGRFGPYLSHNSSFTPLGKNDDPMTVGIERAIELIEAKRIKDTEKQIKLFEENADIKIVLDRWKNPSVYYKKKYFRIPKGKEPVDLTLEECFAIAGVKPGAEKKASAKKATGTKAASTKSAKTTTKKAATAKAK